MKLKKEHEYAYHTCIDLINQMKTIIKNNGELKALEFELKIFKNVFLDKPYKEIKVNELNSQSKKIAIISIEIQDLMFLIKNSVYEKNYKHINYISIALQDLVMRVVEISNIQDNYSHELKKLSETVSSFFDKNI